MKEQLIAQIQGKLTALGVPVQNGNGTDLAVMTEFLDAGFSTGSKKVGYEALIFANEPDSMVYMYEKTTEIGHGFSFGADSGSSFQSGTTLFRKVKSIQYAPDGKAYEYTLDLGAIPKAVKETAKQFGWQYKTVLKREKAMYPVGYAPVFIPQTPVQPSASVQETGGQFCSDCGVSLPAGARFCGKCGKPTGGAAAFQPNSQTSAHQQQYNNPNGAFYAQSSAPAPGKNIGVLGLVGFILLGIFCVAAFVMMSVNPAGWIIGAAILGLFMFLQRKVLKKGCFLSIIIWVTALFLLFMTMVYTSPPGDKAANDSGKADAALAAKLPYEKSFTLNDGKSAGTFKLFVSDGTGFYSDYKGQIICEFRVKFDTSSLPSDFKLRPEQATKNNAMGEPALDGLIMAVCSDTEAYHTSSLSYAAYIYNNGNQRPFVETDASTANVDSACIKNFAAKYPKIQVLRYNQNEVGMSKSGDTWTTHSEKAFGLHPSVAEANIPWNEILSDLGLK